MRKRLPGLLAAGALVCAGGVAAPGITQSQATPITRSQATPITRSQVTPIRHVVVIFEENHSFDSVLGFWCDTQPGRCPKGGMPSKVTLSDGAVVTPSDDPDTVPQVLHSVPAQKAAINGGKMNGWQNIPDGTCDAATGYRCISGYEPAQIPNITSLAQKFAISDDTFSVADSPSWAGHMAMVAASTDNFTGNQPVPVKGVTKQAGWGCDSNKVATWIGPTGRPQYVPSCVPAKVPNLRFGGAFRKTPVSSLPTIMDRLDAAGLSWKIFGAVKGTKDYGKFDICPTFAGCLDTSQDANLVPDAHFMPAARAGTLPSFSIVTPGGPDFVNGCHNQLSMTACDDWIGKLVGAVEQSPDWSSTAVFITWDDCGCFYDQVPPPVEPDGTQDGPRVPLVIVSPYARPGYTDGTATTFAGILAYTEHTFGLAALGVNDAGAYDFSHAFNYAQAPLKPIRMVDRPLPPSAKRIRLTRALLNDPT